MSALDGIAAAIARRQHGVVARRQLLAAGISARWIASRLDKGSLIRVYRVGHAAPSIEADYMAAVLACGDEAVLAGRAAAVLLAVIRRGPAAGPAVICPTKRRIAGIQTKRMRTMDVKDMTKWKGIPVTTPARTLVDLAAVVSAPELARAVHQAGVLHGTTPEEVEDVLQRRPRTKGARDLRDVLRGDQGKTLSNLERLFTTLRKNHGLPLPVTNRPAGGRLVACRWPDYTLTVELDSSRYPRSRHAWEL